MPRASFISMRHASGVPVLALPSRFGVGPILPCLPWSRQPSERRAPKGTISALGGTLSTPLNATMSVRRRLVPLRAENWPRPVLTVTSLGPCSPGTTGLSLMIAWLCASRSKIPPSRYPLKAYVLERGAASPDLPRLRSISGGPPKGVSSAGRSHCGTGLEKITRSYVHMM